MICSARLRRCLAVICAAAGLTAPTVQAQNLTYLQALLAGTPEGGWVKASSNTFSSAWATGINAPPESSFSNPGSIVRAWSSFAWDSTRSELILWGGGHANYRGNEVYLWQGATGRWARGSLSSRVEQVGGSSSTTWLVVDDAAPQSSHTYDGNIYLPINGMFLTFGGGAYDAGVAGFQVSDGNGGLTRAGPWLWDRTKANSFQVGGTSGSGFDPAGNGGNMWINRQGQWSGSEPWSTSYGHAYVNAAYRSEGGKDVVYVSLQDSSGGSGFPGLYRYELGDVRNGGLDKWERVGVSWNAPSYQSVAAIDNTHGLFVHTTSVAGFSADLGVWSLANNNPLNPDANRDVAVQLVTSTGANFNMTEGYAIDYDSAHNKFVLWDGSVGGLVWETSPVLDGNGNVASTWIVSARASTTIAQPSGNFVTAALGKFQYVPELSAFVALNEYNAASQDAEVWLYKPLASAVPEPGTCLMLACGLALVGWRARRQVAPD